MGQKLYSLKSIAARMRSALGNTNSSICQPPHNKSGTATRIPNGKQMAKQCSTAQPGAVLTVICGAMAMAVSKWQTAQSRAQSRLLLPISKRLHGSNTDTNTPAVVRIASRCCVTVIVAAMQAGCRYAAAKIVAAGIAGCFFGFLAAIERHSLTKSQRSTSPSIAMWLSVKAHHQVIAEIQQQCGAVTVLSQYLASDKCADCVDLPIPALAAAKHWEGMPSLWSVAILIKP